MSHAPRVLGLSSVARRLGPLLRGMDLAPASEVSVRAAPAWVAAVGLGAAGGSYWLWLEPATGSALGPGAEARMDQIVLDAPPGRYTVDVHDAATGEILSRESAGGPPLVLGVPSRGAPVAAEIRRVRSSPS